MKKNTKEPMKNAATPLHSPALGALGRGPGGGGAGGPFGGMFAEANKPKNATKTLWRLFTLLRTELLSLLLVFLMVVLAASLSLLATRMIGLAIDLYITPGNLSGLAIYVSQIVAVYALSAGAAWGQTFIMAAVSQRSVARLRAMLFEHIQVLPINYFDKHTRGEIMSKLANDVEALAQSLGAGTTQVLSSVIMVVGAVIAMLLLSPSLTLVTLISVPLSTFIARFIASRTRRLFRERQQNMGQLNGLIEESVTGHKVVQAFGQEKRMMQTFKTVNQKLCMAGTRSEIYSGIVRPIMTVASNLSYAVLAVLGGVLAVRGTLNVGDIASFLQYNRQFSGPVNELANQFNTLQAAIAGLERVYELLDEPRESVDASEAITLKSTQGQVELQNVWFGYTTDTPVLKNISLHASPGSTIALVGATGAGKTSIVNLLMRFYDVNQGQISIDGYNIKDIARQSLRESLGVVLQDTYLFSGTVRENIRFGRLTATNEEIEEVAKVIGADAFIQRLPQGYDTLLIEGGQNLSQGQRQLVAICRAVLANPRILILDEATSSVDTRTEVHVQRAMSLLMKGRTSFVIAHRLSTIKGADQILVIDQGKIVEQGTHNELLEQARVYAQLYASQFRCEGLLNKAIS